MCSVASKIAVSLRKNKCDSCVQSVLLLGPIVSSVKHDPGKMKAIVDMKTDKKEVKILTCTVNYRTTFSKNLSELYALGVVLLEFNCWGDW